MGIEDLKILGRGGVIFAILVVGCCVIAAIETWVQAALGFSFLAAVLGIVFTLACMYILGIIWAKKP